MNTIRGTEAYRNWYACLNDQKAKDRIAIRIKRARNGNFGDHRALGEGVSEMRIDYGPGYRIYFAQEGNTVYLLLLGGDKRNQNSDIKKAKALWLGMGGKRHEK